MFERPADATPPPRVDVHLPDGHTLPGRLLAWRQGTDGSWWAEIAIPVPAAAVHQVDGQDYTHVPRKPAQPAAGYVLTADTRPGQPRAAVLHKGDCVTLSKLARWTSLTPVDNTEQARAMLAFDDTTACDACNPTP